MAWIQVSNSVEGRRGSSFLTASDFSVIKESTSLLGHDNGKKDVKVEGEPGECKIFIWENGNQEPELHLGTEVPGSGSDT